MPSILMLEDDRDRITRFQGILERNHTSVKIQVSRTAPEFIARYPALDFDCDLIALDHDLFPDSEQDPDPGDGRDVAAFLARQAPICPVLIHSTNASAADSMLFTLQEANWTVDRIAPLGEDWIEAYWYPVAMEMIAR